MESDEILLRKPLENLHVNVPAIKRSRNDVFEDDYSEVKPIHEQSTVLASSEQDIQSVDVILKNLMEFSYLAADFGFKLVINCDSPNNVEVCLFNKENESDVEKVLKQMLNLVEFKKMQSNKLEAKIAAIEAKLLTCQEGNKEYRNVFTSELEEKERRLTTCEKEIKKLLTKTTDDFDERPFFHMVNLNLVRTCKNYQNRIIDKLSSIFHDFDFKNYSDKRKELLALCDFLQKDYYVEDVDVLPCLRFGLCSRTHCVYPTRRERDEQRAYFKETFDLDNVIGTVHLKAFDDLIPHVDFQIIFVVNKKIIGWVDNFQFRFTFEKFYDYAKSLENGHDLDEISRFVVADKVDEEFTDKFVECFDEEVFAEGEMVYKWMSDNFQCMEFELFDLLPATYNIFYDCF